MAGNKNKKKGTKAVVKASPVGAAAGGGPAVTPAVVAGALAASPATAVASPPAGGDNAAPIVLAVRVKFTLNTQDGLRRVIFGLEKDTQGNVVIWKINFQLFERDKKSDAFGDAMAELDVEVDHQLHPQAAAAAENGLTPPQTAHATGPAADDAKSAAAGEIDKSDAKDTVQNTLAVPSA